MNGRYTVYCSAFGEVRHVGRYSDMDQAETAARLLASCSHVAYSEVWLHGQAILRYQWDRELAMLLYRPFTRSLT